MKNGIHHRPVFAKRFLHLVEGNCVATGGVAEMFDNGNGENGGGFFGKIAESTFFDKNKINILLHEVLQGYNSKLSGSRSAADSAMYISSAPHMRMRNGCP